MEISPEKLLELRTSKGLSQQEVADYIGVAQRTYGMYEQGLMKPKLAKLLKLIELLEENKELVAREEDVEYNKICAKCKEKNDLIKSLRQTIAAQEELLSLYRKDATPQRKTAG